MKYAFLGWFALFVAYVAWNHAAARGRKPLLKREQVLPKA